MDHSIISSNGKFQTRDGKTFSTLEKAQAHSAKKRAELESRWGIEITDAIWARQVVPAAIDSQDMATKIANRDYTPKKRESLSPLDRRIQELEAAGAKKREADEYKGLNLEERLALDLRKQRAKQEAEEKAEAVKAAHLKANAANIEAAKQWIFEEQFNPESDQRFREQLRKLKLCYETVDVDPTELAEIESSVNSELIAREANEQAMIGQELELIQAREAALKERMRLRDPEPVKSDFVPDPYGYTPPHDGREGITPEQKVSINRDQGPFAIGFELCQAMEASGSFTDDQLSEVRQATLAAREGDTSRLNQLVDVYAE